MLARFIILAVKGYQYLISPLMPCSCRFLPTCSDYAIEACQKHGAITGTILTLKRIFRCHPLAKHGLDPVPIPVKAKNKR